MPVVVPVDGGDEVTTLVVAQGVGAESGGLSDLLNGQFLFHTHTLRVRAHSKSSPWAIAIQIPIQLVTNR